MTVFIDTSAFYALLDQDDSNHARALAVWRRLLQDGARLMTHNYVLVETSALVQHRLGLTAVRVFQDDVVPLLGVEWISEARHRAGVTAVLAASRGKLSLVDCISFQTMREGGVRSAFCFDRHFYEQGFDVLR
ncbi:MAG: type II toxin-antitoxin system VapC family toxin [Bryobacteraceae bacterium]